MGNHGIRFDYNLGFFRRSDTGGISKRIAISISTSTTRGIIDVALDIEYLTGNHFEAINDANNIGASGCWFDPFMFKHFG